MPRHLPERRRDPGLRNPAVLAETGHHVRAEHGRTITVSANHFIVPTAVPAHSGDCNFNGVTPDK